MAIALRGPQGDRPGAFVQLYAASVTPTMSVIIAPTT